MDRKRWITSWVLIALVALFAGGCEKDPKADAGPDGSSSEGASGSVPIQLASVAVGDDEIIFSGTLQASPAEVSITNDGTQQVFLFFGRLNEGITQEKLIKAVADNPDAAFGLVTAAGGAQVEAGTSSTLTVEFPEGEYIAVNPDAFGKIASSFFTVGPATQTIDEPEADFGLEVGEFYFKISEGIPAGTVTFAISNAGEQSHEVIIERKGDKKAGGFAIAPAPGGTVWADFELTPGEYTAMCFFPDPETGKPHFKLGMRQPFVVE